MSTSPLTTSTIQILDQLHTIAEYTAANEPGVIKYAIAVPDNAQDATSIYLFEE